MARGPKAPTCGECGIVSRLTTGAEIYPYRPDLAAAWFYRCDNCDGRVGCHKGTKRPLGTPAGPRLRHARECLHGLLDPIWLKAPFSGPYEIEDGLAVHRIRQTARTRVYRYLAAHLMIDPRHCHVGMFDLETCRKAWRVLKPAGKPRIEYLEIRQWIHEQEAIHHDEEAVQSSVSRVSEGAAGAPDRNNGVPRLRHPRHRVWAPRQPKQQPCLWRRAMGRLHMQRLQVQRPSR